jgi:hypothetical protein
MVNKVDLSASIQAQGVNLLLQELLGEYPMQVFAALAQMGDTDLSLPSKIAVELLSKNIFEGTAKLDRLVTLLPSLKNLSAEAVKMPEAGGKSEFSQDAPKGQPQDSFKNPSSREGGKEQTKGTPEAAGSPKQLSEKGNVSLQGKGESFQRGIGDLANPVLQNGLKMSEKPLAGLELPAMVNTIKEVLSILSYFASNPNVLKPESIDMFQKVMKPVMDQLVKPVQKPTEGELGSKHQEPRGGNVVEKLSPKEKSLPFPTDLHHKSEKTLNRHQIEQTPKGMESFSRNDRAAANPGARSQEGAMKTNASQSLAASNPAEAKPVPMAIPLERTAISAAPFSFQHPISTAPRRAKKKPKDSWEEEKERLEDEEDPFTQS